MKMVVSSVQERTAIVVFEKTIRFDYDLFQRLIAIPDGKIQRSVEYLDLARDILGDI